MRCVLAALSIVVGCNKASTPAEPLPHEVEQFPVAVSRELDLLFLIDDSPSMSDKQTNLANGLPHLIDVLGAMPGGLPDLHIGVVTSDLGSQGVADSPPWPTVGDLDRGRCAGTGNDGSLQLFAAMAVVGDDPFLRDTYDPVANMRVRNYSGALASAFTQMVRAGDAGCAFEQHLEAIKHALAPGNAANQGFLRPDANLGVIIFADEDDCSLAHNALLGPGDATLGALQSFRCTRFGVTCDDSGMTPDDMNRAGRKDRCHPNDSSSYLTRVGDHAAFLKGLKTDPAKISVAAIGGTTDAVATELRVPPGGAVAVPALAHSCTYVGGDGSPEVADPAIRIRSFLDQFQNRNAFASICARDLSAGLGRIGDALKTALGIPCLESALADTDPDTPGIQVECTVSVTTGQPATGRALPRCTPEDASATNKPCWHLTTDAVSCPSGDHVAPAIEGRDTLDDGAYVVVSCAIESPTPRGGTEG